MNLLAAAVSGAINWHSVMFYVTSLLACGFALTVLLTNNIVRMAFALIVSLSATSGLLFLAGAYFVGSMQLMIYVGGTVVLLIFGVMLTAQKAFITMRTGAGDWMLGLLLGGALLGVLVHLAFSIPQWESSDFQAKSNAELEAYVSELEAAVKSGKSLTHGERRKLVFLEAAATDGQPQRVGEIGLALVGLRPDRDPDESQGLAGYLLPFEIVSVHLLVVLVGAAYLARAKRQSS